MAWITRRGAEPSRSRSAGGVEIGNYLSAVLVAELADPAKRCVRLQEFLLVLTRVRRQDNLAGKLAIERERRARERVKERADDAHQKEFAKEWEPIGRQFKRSYMTDLYAETNFTSQMLATHEAESLLRNAKPDGTRSDTSSVPDKPESN